MTTTTRAWADYSIPCPCCDPVALRASPLHQGYVDCPNIKPARVTVQTIVGDTSHAGLIGQGGRCARCGRGFVVDCLDGNREPVLVEVDA